MTHANDVDTAVRVRGLIKKYGDKTVVGGLDLDIQHGEVFALLGPNGAGKTTTIEILEGYRKRDGGTVSVLGQDPQTAGGDWRQRIGIVAQTATDAAELTVAEVVRSFAGYYKHSRDPEEVISLVGLTEKRNTRIRRLSGGQRRRVDVALGIIGDPALLFLDEPTTGFDPGARRQFWELIRALRTGGTTILLTTHYLDEVEQLADRVAVIADGKLLDLGTPQSIGGADSRTAVVRYTDLDGTKKTIPTATPSAVLREMLGATSGELADLEVVRPTLEDVYLALIGENPQDAAISGANAIESAEGAAS